MQAFSTFEHEKISRFISKCSRVVNYCSQTRKPGAVLRALWKVLAAKVPGLLFYFQSLLTWPTSKPQTFQSTGRKCLYPNDSDYTSDLFKGVQHNYSWSSLLHFYFVNKDFPVSCRILNRNSGHGEFDTNWRPLYFKLIHVRSINQFII